LVFLSYFTIKNFSEIKNFKNFSIFASGENLKKILASEKFSGRILEVFSTLQIKFGKIIEKF